MNDASPQTNPILAKALRTLSELAAPESPAQSEWSRTLVSELSQFLPPPSERSGNLIGPHVAGPGLRWHADQLVALCQAQTEADSATARARRRYHARMLGHGLAPSRAGFRPVVTVLLPVYNRAGPLVEAVQSCVDQTWRPIEILVIDDGSTDDVRSALQPFGDQVRLIRKANGGAASARNIGLSKAEGDFVHLLDSDDLLTPTAVENAIAAFATVADADLCYGQGQWIDMRATPPQVKELRFRELHNPIRSLIVEFAFTVPTVMMPRWRMLAMPPFEEDLRRSEDWRYWQNLGFARAKVVGIRTLSAYLRRFEHSLQATPHPNDDSHAVAVLRGLRDLIRHPHAWPYAVEYMNLLIDRRSRGWFVTAPSGRVQTVLSELTARQQAGHMRSEDGILSLLPVLVAMRGRVQQLRRYGHWSGEHPACVYDVLAASLSRAIDGAAPISDRDVAFWTKEPEAPIRYHGLLRFFASIRHRCPPSNSAAFADALLRKSQKVPRRGCVRLAARLRPIIGSRVASAMAARWFS